MTHLQNLPRQCLLKWVSSHFSQNQFVSSKPPFWPNGSFPIAQQPRFFGRPKILRTENCNNLDETLIDDCENVGRISSATLKQAQAALLEYLHSTRSLQFMDAENMSKNSPHFLEKLLKKVEIEEDVGRSITRFLRYHPINEFEPFFESMGFKPSEYASFLPRNLMFLCDDVSLLENYNVLCNFGIARNIIGRVYKDAPQVFQYDFGVLQSKLRAYEELGLSQSFLVKIIPCSPYLLVGDVNVEFCKIIEKFKSFGIKFSWVEKQLSESCSYNWGQMLGLICLVSKVGCSEEQLARMFSKHPGLLFEYSGTRTLLLVVFLLKFGLTKDQLCSMFLQFPQITIGKFISNLRQAYIFLTEIDMEIEDIRKLICSHPILLGSSALKKVNSILSNLNVGKKRLCALIMHNPLELKNWVLGIRVQPLPSEHDKSRTERIKFLLDMGVAKNSAEMEKALKAFRGKGGELQERFDCIVKAGLDRKDVVRMIKVSPQILNQSKNVIEMKIHFLVYDMGYPISTLAKFPSYLSYTTQRVKLRLTMYNWLKERGKVEPKLTLCTVVACSDKTFITQYVNQHSEGPQVWQELKKNIYSE